MTSRLSDTDYLWTVLLLIITTRDGPSNNMWTYKSSWWRIYYTYTISTNSSNYYAGYYPEVETMSKQVSLQQASAYISATVISPSTHTHTCTHTHTNIISTVFPCSYVTFFSHWHNVRGITVTLPGEIGLDVRTPFLSNTIHVNNRLFVIHV